MQNLVRLPGIMNQTRPLPFQDPSCTAVDLNEQSKLALGFLHVNRSIDWRWKPRSITSEGEDLVENVVADQESWKGDEPALGSRTLWAEKTYRGQGQKENAERMRLYYKKKSDKKKEQDREVRPKAKERDLKQHGVDGGKAKEAAEKEVDKLGQTKKGKKKSYSSRKK